MTVKTEREILDTLIPEVELENVTLETYRRTEDSEGNIKRDVSVTIRFSISDVVERDVIGRWFNQVDYEKYFGVNVWIYYAVEGAYTQYGAAQRAGDTHKGSKRINIQTMNTEDVVELVTPDGSTVNKFLFERTFKIPTTFTFSGTKELTSLSMKLSSFFNIEEMERDLSIDLFGMSKGDMMREKSVNIISGGKVVYPVQDFRSRQSPLETFSFSDPLRQALSHVGQRFRETLIKEEKASEQTNEHFSDLWLSRNAQGESSFMFFLDLQTYMEKKSQYRHYVKRMSEADKVRLLASLKVPTLKFLRKRVSVTSSNRGREVVKFEKEREEVIVAETSKHGNSAGLSFFKKTVRPDHGAIKQVHLSELGNERGVYFLTGTDYAVAQAMNGVYSYGIEFDIIDTTKYFLLQKIEEVRKSASFIKKIHAEIISSKHYDTKTRYLKKSPELILGPNSPLATFSLQASVRRLETLLNIFTEGLVGNDNNVFSKPISSFLSSFPTIQNLKSPEMLAALLDVMDITISNCLHVLGEPANGDSNQSIRKGTDLRVTSRKFYDSLTEVFDSTIPKKNGLEYLSNFSLTSNVDVLREISTLAKDSGKIGLRIVDGASMKDRIETESKKFFESSGMDISFPFPSSGIPEQISINACGSEFLTPSIILDTSVPEGASRMPSNIATSIRSSLLDSNVASTATRLSTSPGLSVFRHPVLERKAASTFAFFGASFDDSKSSQTLLVEDEGVVNYSVSNSRRDRVTETLDFITSEEKEELMEQVKFEEYVFSKFSRMVSTPHLGTERTLTADQAPELEDFSNPQSDSNPFLDADGEQDFRCAPNAVRALALGASSPQTTYPELDSTHWNLSMGFLIAIEFVSGFEGGKINNPIWSPLTHEVYSRNASKTLLCRIKRAHLQRLGVRTIATDKPIFDEFFFVSPVGDFDLVDTGDPSQLSFYQENQEAQRRDTSLASGIPLREDIIAEKERERDRLCHEVAQSLHDTIKEYDRQIFEAHAAIRRIQDNPESYDAGEEYSTSDNFFGASRSEERFQDSLKPDAQFAIDHHRSIIRRLLGSHQETGNRPVAVRELNRIHEQIDKLTEEINRYERSLGLPRSFYGCPLIIT